MPDSLQNIDRPRLDIERNRKACKYPKGELVRRCLWWFGKWLFRLTPRPCFAWRSLLLRCFGGVIGHHVRTCPSIRILFPWNLRLGNWSCIGEDVRIYNPGLVTIGERVTISHGAQLCSGTHDYTRAEFPLLKKPIEVRDQVWVCSDGFLGPGVVVEEGAVIGARAVVTGRVKEWTVVAGNPARFIRLRELNQISDSFAEPRSTAR